MDVDLELQSLINKSQKGCVREAMPFLEGFSEDDLYKFIKDVYDKAQTDRISLNAAADQLKSEIADNLKNKMYVELDNYEKVKKQLTGIKQKEFKLQDSLNQNSRLRGGLNVETQQTTTKRLLKTKIYDRLGKYSQEILLRGEHDNFIAAAYDGDTLPNTLDEKTKAAINEIASSLKTYIEKDSKFELLSSCARTLSDLNKYRLFRATYNYSKVRGLKPFEQIYTKMRRGEKILQSKLDDSKQYFVSQMMKRANIDLMFSTAADKEAAAEEAFSNMFDNIVTNRQKVSLTIKDLPEMAKRTRQFVVWKDMKSYLDHQREFGEGRGSFYESMTSDTNSVGNEAGLAKVFGYDSDWSFAQLNKLDPGTSANPNINQYLRLRNITSIPYNPSAAQVMANIRAFTQMGKGLLFLPLTINDANMGTQYVKAMFGTSALKQVMGKLNATLTFYGVRTGLREMPEEFSKALRNMSDGLNAEVGAYGRIMDGSNVGSTTQKITNNFWKFIGMTDKDLSHRCWAVAFVMKEMKRMYSRSFEELPEGLQNRLKAFNFDPVEYEEMRKSGLDFAIDGANQLSDEAYKRIGKKLGLSQITAKSELCAKTFGFLEAVAQETILYPGNYEKTFWERGTQAGTFAGELFRSVAQFKGFLTAYTTRILINGMRESKWHYLLHNFLYTVPLTLLANSMYSASQGKAPNLDMSTWSADDYLETFLPSYAMMGRVLNPSAQNPADLALFMLQSPSTKALLDAGVLGFNVGTLQGKKAAKSSQRLLLDTTPLGQVPYVGPWWRQQLHGGN